MPTPLLLVILYAASVALITCGLRLLLGWRHSFSVATVWPWHVARIAFLLAWAWIEERDYD